MYATFEQYKKIGGKLDEESFNSAYIEAKFKLEYWTHNRVATFENDNVDSPDWVVYSIKTIIDTMYDVDATVSSFTSIAVDGDTLESYSNGVETYHFATASASQVSAQAKVLEQSAYRKVVEAAPVEFVSWAVS